MLAAGGTRWASGGRQRSREKDNTRREREEPEQSEPGRKRSLDNEGALTLLSLAIREGEYVL